MTKKTYRPWETDRTYLLPPSTRDWLPDGHLATFILDLVDELDIREIEAPIQAKDPRGEKPYAPRMMVALLLYGYCSGVFSSRRLARATWTDVGARVIAAESHPHFTTINLFRLDHHEALAALFLQVLKLCDRAGLVDLGHVAIDGTKIQANASKHKAMSYDRMKATEARLQGEVDALLAKAEAVNKCEDAEFGPEGDGSTLPEELRRRETRLKRLRQAREALEQEALAARRLELEAQASRARKAAAAATDADEAAKLTRRAVAREQKAEELNGAGVEEIPGGEDGLPFHKVPHDRHGLPKAKAQRNFTDSDSRIMELGGTYIQGYNCQLAVEESHQVVVAQVVTNQAPDSEHAVPLIEQIQESLHQAPTQLTADAGYWSEATGRHCEDAGIDAYISTRRRTHREQQGDQGEARPPPPAARTAAGQAMEAKVLSEAGRAVYAKRKWTVEPVFGQMKEGRTFRRFQLRGLRKARSEFSLLCTGHNILKLWRSAKRKA